MPSGNAAVRRAQFSASQPAEQRLGRTGKAEAKLENQPNAKSRVYIDRRRVVHDSPRPATSLVRCISWYVAALRPAGIAAGTRGRPRDRVAGCTGSCTSESRAGWVTHCASPSPVRLHVSLEQAYSLVRFWTCSSIMKARSEVYAQGRGKLANGNAAVCCVLLFIKWTATADNTLHTS